MPDDLKYQVMAADLAERERVWAREHNLPIPPEPERPAAKLPSWSTLPMYAHVCGLQGLAPAVGLSQYGDEVLLTLAMVEEHLLDRFGHCAVIELLGDEGAQVERFGAVMLRAGRWPEGAPKIVPGSEEWKIGRSDAFARARSGGFEVDRRTALAQVKAQWGPEFAPTASPEVFANTYGLQGLSGRMA